MHIWYRILIFEPGKATVQAKQILKCQTEYEKETIDIEKNKVEIWGTVFISPFHYKKVIIKIKVWTFSHSCIDLHVHVHLDVICISPDIAFSSLIL